MAMIGFVAPRHAVSAMGGSLLSCRFSKGQSLEGTARTTEPSSSRHRGRNALLLQEGLELARLKHLADDVAAADQLALDVELREGRPVAELLEALPQVGVLEDVVGLVLHTDVGEHLHDGGGEAAHREDGRALHVEDDVVARDLLADAVEDRLIAHFSDPELGRREVLPQPGAEVDSASACSCPPMRSPSAL